MTSTRFRLIGVALFVVALSALEAFQWDGEHEDEAKMKACIGGTASFPWSYALALGETMLLIDWWFQAPGKENGTQIATYINKHFYATGDARVDFLPDAGLSLRHARPQDSGNYSVQVKLEQGNSSIINSGWRTAMLSVTDRPPATRDGALHVTLSDAVLDDVTEDWTLQLHCGQFVDLGHPPVDVVWKTPSGEVRNSSYEDNGTFVLSVSSPVQGGYSCHLPPSAPAVRCLAATSPLTAAAQLYVDDKDVRLSLLEARQREIEQVNKDQASLLDHQAMQISQQNGTMADMVGVNKDQANLLQHQASLLEHQAMQISQQNETMADMVGVNKDQANLLEHQAMQISQQNGTMADMVGVNKDQANLLEHQANLLEHQAMQISQQNGTMADMVRVNKDQANLLEHQAMQISQQNGTMADMVRVNKDQANLLQHQAMQLQEQGLYLNQTISELITQCSLRPLKNPAGKHQGTHEPLASHSCVDWLSLDPLSGIRRVCVSREPVNVYCDQTTDNGGWIVFQRRMNASVDFYRGWTEYRNGFGDLEGNFWLGLDKLHKLTTSQMYELRVDLHKWDGTKGYATYSDFYVEDVSHNFALRYDNFTGGNAGDSLAHHRGNQFSTKDRDHDESKHNCARKHHGAWWYSHCHNSNLNGDYKSGKYAPKYDGLAWFHFGFFYPYSMKFTEMKIRPM